jgi:Uma2 family endonuclease
MAVATLKRYSIEEWHRLEEETGRKCEYLNGEIFAMAGGSPAHNRLAANFSGIVGASLFGSDCGGFSSDQCVRIEATGLNTYPDYTVVCGDEHYAEDDPRALLNLTLVVEVLSSSTERYDRGEKSRQYRLIPSLREYVFVRQDRPHVEVYTRQKGGSWRLREAEGPDAVIRLESVGCDIPLARLYERVELQPEPERSLRLDHADGAA